MVVHVDNGIMLPFVNGILVLDLANIDLLLEGDVERSPPEVYIPDSLARTQGARPGSHEAVSIDGGAWGREVAVLRLEYLKALPAHECIADARWP